MAFVLTLIYIAVSLLSPAVLPQGMAEIHVNQILAGLTILAILVSNTDTKPWRLPETYFGVGIVIAAALSTLATGWMGGVSGTISELLPVIIPFYFIVSTCRTRRHLRVLAFVLAAVAFFILFQDLRAYRSGQMESEYFLREGASLIRIRGLGVLNDPNDLAQFLVGLTPLFWLRWQKKRRVGNILFTLIPASILAIGVFFTHSRGGSFALLAVLLFAFKNRLGLVKASILASLGLVLLLTLNVSGGRGMDSDDGDRVGLWSEGLQAFKLHPVFGVGMGNMGDYTDTHKTAHNSYVLCLAEMGVVGYFFWMGMIVFTWEGLTGLARARTASETAEDPLGKSNFPEVRYRQPPLYPSFAARGASADSLALTRTDLATTFVPTSKQKADVVRPGARPTNTAADESTPDRNSLASSAAILRSSLVGLLTAGFFISRTYAMVLYIFLGMSVALTQIHLRQHPGPPRCISRLLKRTALVLAVSVVFLYLFVRVHGAN